MGKNEIFPLGTEYCCTTLWVKKFVPNHSILYGFKDIHTFSFSAKIKDGRQKWRKLKFLPFVELLLYYPAGQIAVSRTAFKIFTLSHLLLEIIRIYSF